MYSFLGFKTHTSSHFCSTHGVSDRLLGHRKSCWLQKHAVLLLRFGSEPKQGDWQWHSSTLTTPQPQLLEYLTGKPEYRLDPQQAGPRHGGRRGSGREGARWTRPHTGRGDYRPPPRPSSPFIFVKPSLPPTNPPASGARSGRVRGNPASGRARKMAATSRLRDLGALGLLFFKGVLVFNVAAAGQGRGGPSPASRQRFLPSPTPAAKRKR